MAVDTPAQAAPEIIEANQAVRLRLPFADAEDFDEARRGWIGSLSDPVIRATDGRVVWDAAAYEFLDGECPATVNPSLWRQSRLAAIHGLFEVADGIYQVRGLDLSVMTIVEGDTGVLVIDPLISTECAAAALALYREHRGERPVTGLLYTHSHVDHFGGARGVVSPGDVASGRVPVLAPDGFLAHAVSENVYAGGAMTRRATYMYGALLPKGAAGQVGAGLGQTTSTGTVTLIPPTVDITRTGQEETVDGIHMVFQLAPNTEAPAEMHFLFPERRALCIAENATHNLHNILTLRGALVRDPHGWASYLDEAIGMFASGSDVMFAQHHWPRWGTDRIVDFLAKQRDLYGYIHDQALRLLNKGYVPAEIAERLELPPSLEREWHCRGYYGSLNHNLKAVYQRYLGWFDGNPAHLWPHPPEAAGERYVALAGGAGRPARPRRRRVRARRLPLGRRSRQPPRVRRSRQHRRQGPPGAGPRTARIRGREWNLAQLLPHGRPRAAARPRRDRGRDPVRLHRQPHERAALRRARDPDRRAARRRPPHHPALAVHRHRQRALPDSPARGPDPPPRRPRRADRRHRERPAQRAERRDRRRRHGRRSSSRPGGWPSKAIRPSSANCSAC